jgi:hypothetical protein
MLSLTLGGLWSGRDNPHQIPNGPLTRRGDMGPFLLLAWVIKRPTLHASVQVGPKDFGGGQALKGSISGLR